NDAEAMSKKPPLVTFQSAVAVINTLPVNNPLPDGMMQVAAVIFQRNLQPRRGAAAAQRQSLLNAISHRLQRVHLHFQRRFSSSPAPPLLRGSFTAKFKTAHLFCSRETATLVAERTPAFFFFWEPLYL